MTYLLINAPIYILIRPGLQPYNRIPLHQEFAWRKHKLFRQVTCDVKSDWLVRSLANTESEIQLNSLK